jgi:signal transduction histidine kinase
VPIAVLTAVIAAWWLAGAALAPVERMRSGAADIVCRSPRPSSLPPADDEITRLGATMNDLLDRIQASVETERRFIDDASHELRTPLSILKTELVWPSPANGAQMSCARRCGARPKEPTISSGSPRISWCSLAPTAAVSGARHAHGSPSAARGHRGAASTASDGAGVAIDVDASSGAVCVDQVRLRQAIDDLLDNAVRYTPRGGVITVTGSVEGGTIALSVLDSGPGFSADVLSRAFEPFVGDLGAGGAGRDGAGLGLSIVRVIADAHGGSVEAENTPGGGARVTMTIADLA